MNSFSKQLVKEYFRYTNGSFVRVKSTGSSLAGQKTIGTKHHTGYMRIRFLGKQCAFHRLVWSWHYGETKFRIDHINGRKDDNRIENLRLSNSASNSWNQGKHRQNTSGHKGLFFDKRDKLWYGAVQANGKRVKVGWSKNKNKTLKVLIEKRKELHGEFAKN